VSYFLQLKVLSVKENVVGVNIATTWYCLH